MQDSGTRVSPATIDAVVRALHASGALTRAAIGSETGLSRPSVSTLLVDGMVEETDTEANGRGRPSRRIRLSTRRADTVGFELGRRHVAVAVADARGTVVAADTRDVDPATSLVDRGVAALELLDRTCAAGDIDLAAVRRVAVGTPGPRFDGDDVGGPVRRVPSPGSSVFDRTRLEFERSRIVDLLVERFAVPVDVGNNTRYTAVAEGLRHGPDADLVYLRLDEGVGGGLVEHGSAVAGAIGAGGEIGHVTVDPLGARCPCGGRGCLELVASLPAVVLAAGARDIDDLRDHLGTPAAAAAVEQAATAAGGVLAGVVATVNPAVLVLGGAVAELPGFLPRLDAVLRDAAPDWATAELRVEAAATDHLQGAIGAATAAAAALDALVPLHRKDA